MSQLAAWPRVTRESTAMYHLRVPQTEEELDAYYHFRWEMLRKPLHQPKGSERDAWDAMAHHQMVVDEEGTVRKHCVRTIHAEQNAICQAARYGISLEGATLYCKMEPCRVCAMMIISSGIKKVVALKKYHAAEETRNMFKEVGISLVVVEDKFEEYQNQ